MKKTVLIGFTLLGMLICCQNKSMAQNISCGETLNVAQNRFDNGDFYSIPSLLKPCLDNGFSDQQKVEAFWLLTQTYLFLDDPISAEDSYLKLLRIDPLYEVDEELDPVDVVYLSEKFTTRPRIVLGAHLGVNTTLVDVIHPYSLSQIEGTADYSGKIGIQGGISIEYVVNDFLSVGTELNMIQRKYEFSKSVFGLDEQEFTETQTMIDLPVFARYRFSMNRITPYVYAGIGIHYLTGANGEAVLTDKSQSDGGFSEFRVEGPPINVMGQRNKITYSFVAGGGLLLPIKYNYIKIDLRLMQGARNSVNEENHYGNNELLFRYAYIDDYRRLNNFILNIGFVKPIYKPRRKKSRK